LSAVCQRTERSTDVGAGQVIDLERGRVERLVPTIVADLRAGGTAFSSIEDDGDLWRNAARVAGKALAWHIRTGVSAGRAWAVAEEWETPLDADRNAARRLGAILFGASPFGRPRTSRPAP